MLICSSIKVDFNSVNYLDYDDHMLSEYELDWSQTVQQSDLVRSDWTSHKGRKNKLVDFRFSKIKDGFADVEAARAWVLAHNVALPDDTYSLTIGTGATEYTAAKATLVDASTRIHAADRVSVEYSFLLTELAAV